MSSVADILLSALVLALCVLLLAAMMFGALATLAPNLAQRLQERSSRRFSTRRSLKWAEWPHQIERFFYRHHRLFGLCLLSLGGFALWVVFARLEPAALVNALAGSSVHRLWLDVVITTARLLLLAGLCLAVVLSLVIIVRPSLLKQAETRTNRWVSSRQAMRGMEHEQQQLNQQFERHPRLFGLLILLSSSVLLALLWPVTQYFLGR